MPDPIIFLPAAISPVLTWLLQALNRLRDAELRERAEFTAAVDALDAAAIETRAYLADRSAVVEGIPGDREREVKLAGLWNTAANRVRAFDSTLADICGIKSDYWVDPRAFERDRHWEEYRIRIDHVIAQIEAVKRRPDMAP